jgi:glucan phosphoethanolaminetransferase (alkaline phosphatase superfamily)
MDKGWLKDKRRVIELTATLVLAGVIVWQYGSLAPRVIIVLSFLLSLAVAFVQLPFLIGFYGRRRFRPALVILIVVLPFLISLGYEFMYHKDLLKLFIEEWIGEDQTAVSVIMVIVLPALSFLTGSLSRKYLRK